MKLKLNDFIVSGKETILQVMKVIDRNAKGIAFVCEDERLVGVITDGDIRRYIISNGDLNGLVENIANKAPKFIYNYENVDYESIMIENAITALPIVNKKQKLQSIKFLHDGQAIKKRSINAPVVIMAGGKGTRLYPYTQILPKPLIPVGEKTITELIMERFEAYECNHFDMIVNYKKNFIKAFFNDEAAQKDIDFIEEKEFLGTGGGLKLLYKRYTTPFFMTNCDILVEDDYFEIMNHHLSEKNIITIVTATKNVTIPYGTVNISDNGQVKEFTEKPSYSFLTNTGFYVISPEFLEYIPDNTFIHITDVIKICIENGERVGIYPISENAWMDMGQLDELEKMRTRLNVDVNR